MTALWEIDGDRAVASELSRGPWDPGACHGGPVSALLARAAERADGHEGAWQIARLSIELTRPVPVGRPLELGTAIERDGRKVSLVAAWLQADGVEVARVRALRIRRRAIELPPDVVVPGAPPMADVTAGRLERPAWAEGDPLAFHRDGAEHRAVEGSWADPGPIAVWIRLRVPVVEDEEPTGVQRVAAAADFGNGVSGALPYDGWTYINPDLTVHLARPPVGEWIGLRSASWYGRDGAGLAESELHDRDGRLGRSVQSLLVEPR